MPAARMRSVDVNMRAPRTAPSKTNIFFLSVGPTFAFRWGVATVTCIKSPGLETKHRVLSHWSGMLGWEMKQVVLEASWLPERNEAGVLM